MVAPVPEEALFHPDPQLIRPLHNGWVGLDPVVVTKLPKTGRTKGADLTIL